MKQTAATDPAFVLAPPDRPAPVGTASKCVDIVPQSQAGFLLAANFAAKVPHHRHRVHPLKNERQIVQ